MNTGEREKIKRLIELVSFSREFVFWSPYPLLSAHTHSYKNYVSLEVHSGGKFYINGRVYVSDLTPYHLEDGIETHTLMVVNELFKKLPELENKYPENVVLSLFLAALFHDLGKPLSRIAITNKKGQTTLKYQKHEIASFNILRDFSHRHRKELLELGLTDEDIVRAMILVLAHQVDAKSEEFFNQLFAGNLFVEKDFTDLLFYLNDADILGRISLKEISPAREFFGNKKEVGDCDSCAELELVRVNSHEEMMEFVKNFVVKNKEFNLIVPIATPASGKSKLVSLLEDEVSSVSFDDIRIKLYEEATNSKVSDENFQEAHDFVMHSKELLQKMNSTFTSEVASLLRNGKRVFVDATNISKRFRKPLGTFVRRAQNKTLFVFMDQDLKSTLKHAKLRTKNVPASVVSHHYYFSSLPEEFFGVQNAKVLWVRVLDDGNEA